MHYPSRRVPETLALCAALVAFVDCSSSKTGPKPTGSMTVVITAANGTTPSVVISGPNAYSKTISTSQTLSGLALGSYTIVADSAVGPDSVVGTITDTGSVTGSPAAVAANATANVSVAYALKHRVGGLWIANNAYRTIPELASNQLRHSGKPVPADTLATGVSGPAGLAIDPNGNLWESSFMSDSLVMYSPAARNAGGGAAPTIAIASTALTDAEGIAFDSHGNLWVANRTGNLLEYTGSQLATSGTQSPAVTITGGAVLVAPEAIAFDANGNAWVVDFSNPHIVEYSAAQLVASGTPTPVDTIGSNGGSLASPSFLAFDASGNLWVTARSSPPVLVEYTPAQLTAGGAPVPHTTITLPSGAPFGLVFDGRGTAWVSDDGHGVMYGLTRAQLAASGTPTPAVADTLTLTGGFQPEQAVFDPHATAVGVSTDRVRHPMAAPSVVRRSNPNLSQRTSR